jgi:hypothetical protein
LHGSSDRLVKARDAASTAKLLGCKVLTIEEHTDERTKSGHAWLHADRTTLLHIALRLLGTRSKGDPYTGWLRRVCDKHVKAAGHNPRTSTPDDARAMCVDLGHSFWQMSEAE